MSYIETVVNRHRSKDINFFAEIMVINPLKKHIINWAGECLQEISYSGSYAKGTALDSTSDLDLFVSLKSDTENTLKDIYTLLGDYLSQYYDSIRMQNVSIRVCVQGYDIDVVPAKNNKGNTNMHKLYTSKKDSWIQTNIKKHIDIVRGSNRTIEIAALKIWRNINQLKFPSIMIEQMTVNALKGRKIGDYENNVWFMIHYIKDNIETIRVIDPANSNNIISDNMFKYEKTEVRKAALISSQKKNWNEILW